MRRLIALLGMIIVVAFMATGVMDAATGVILFLAASMMLLGVRRFARLILGFAYMFRALAG